MSPQEITDILRTKFGSAVTAPDVEGKHPNVTVTPEALHNVALFLRDDPRLAMNMLRCVSGLDGHPEPWLEVVYELISMRPAAPGALWENAGTFALRVRIPRDKPTLRSVVDVWPAADWHERETYDLFGIAFAQHPDLRRILCPDDWAGWPLRKDYEFPSEYHGIPGSTEFGQVSPRH